MSGQSTSHCALNVSTPPKGRAKLKTKSLLRDWMFSNGRSYHKGSTKLLSPLSKKTETPISHINLPPEFTHYKLENIDF